jgi:hypothetical protein
MMKLVLLDYSRYELLVDFMNDVLKEYHIRERRLDVGAKARIYRVLSILLSSNYSKKQSGIVSYERNEKDNRNPYVLCDGNLIYETNLEEMPILLHTKAYNYLFDSKLLKTMQNYFLIEQIPLEGLQLRQAQAMGLGTKHYYKFTKAARKLVPKNPKWEAVNDETAEFMKKYFIKKNRLEDELYLHLIEMLPEFEFKLPKLDVFLERHKDKHTKKIHHKRTPEELMKANYSRMQNFNQYDVDQLICNSSSCEEKWSGRFYSPITSLSKYCRRYLIHSATQSHLVELDIQTCQYHMINRVLRTLFGDECTGNLHTHLSTGINVYVEIAKYMHYVPSPSQQQIGTAKQEAFGRLFSGFTEPKDNSLWEMQRSYEAINTLYPDLINAVELLKDLDIENFEKTLSWRDQLDLLDEEDLMKKLKVELENMHRKVSFASTCMEVQVMKNVWRRLNDAGIVYLTMHDAVYVTPDKETVAKGLFEQALKDELGYIPTVRAELMDGSK